MYRIALRTSLLACAALSAGFTLPPAASAAPYMVSVMQDDNELAYGSSRQRATALDRMKGLGVEAVRVTMLWKAIAPKNTAKKKPAGFDGSNPGAYDPVHWDNYDD